MIIVSLYRKISSLSKSILGVGGQLMRALALQISLLIVFMQMFLPRVFIMDNCLIPIFLMVYGKALCLDSFIGLMVKSIHLAFLKQPVTILLYQLYLHLIVVLHLNLSPNFQNPLEILPYVS